VVGRRLLGRDEPGHRLVGFEHRDTVARGLANEVGVVAHPDARPNRAMIIERDFQNHPPRIWTLANPTPWPLKYAHSSVRLSMVWGDWRVTNSPVLGWPPIIRIRSSASSIPRQWLRTLPRGHTRGVQQFLRPTLRGPGREGELPKTFWPVGPSRGASSGRGQGRRDQPPPLPAALRTMAATMVVKCFKLAHPPPGLFAAPFRRVGLNQSRCWL